MFSAGFAVQLSGPAACPNHVTLCLSGYSSGETKASCEESKHTGAYKQNQIPGGQCKAVALFRLLKGFHDKAWKAGFPS